MEYQRHPEVNNAWTRFCEMVYRRFPGGHEMYKERTDIGQAETSMLTILNHNTLNNTFFYYCFYSTYKILDFDVTNEITS